MNSSYSNLLKMLRNIVYNALNFEQFSVARLPKEDVNKIKQKRITLKNRGYAASCREKRDHEQEILKLDLENLKWDIDELKKTNIEKRRQLKEVRECYKFRQEWVKKEPRIKLPEHLLQPLPPVHADPVN